MPEYRYQKICQLSRCRKAFGTNRKWQDYCENAHRIEHNQTEAKNIRDLNKRIRNLEREIHKKKEVIDAKD